MDRFEYCIERQPFQRLTTFEHSLPLSNQVLVNQSIPTCVHKIPLCLQFALLDFHQYRSRPVLTGEQVLHAGNDLHLDAIGVDLDNVWERITPWAIIVSTLMPDFSSVPTRFLRPGPSMTANWLPDAPSRQRL